MSYKQIIINWILTIVFGSLLLPFSEKLIPEREFIFGFELVPFVLIFGLFTSIPALVLMLLFNYSLEENRMKMQNKIITLWVLNTLAISATFLVLFGNKSFFNDLIYIILPYVLVNSVYYAYFNAKPYHKPEVLNFPS